MNGQRQIMLIDDEPEFLEASRRTLEAHDYRVQTASSTEQARELLMRLRPDLIVLGTLAPAGQAFILHQWLRRHPRHRDVPLVVVDAASDQRQAKGWRKLEGLQLEADEYLTKPMEPAALVPCIQALLTQVEKTIRVLVADDHAIVRDGIAAVVRLQKGMEVVGEAVDGHDAVEKALDLLPTVILMDIVMPGMNGLEATRRIVEAFPQARILILTQYDEEENMLVARQAGASGFIPKRAASSELVNGIRSVSGGEYFPAAFAAVSSS